MLKDATEKELPAKTVFSLSIKYLVSARSNPLNSLQNSCLVSIIHSTVFQIVLCPVYVFCMIVLPFKSSHNIHILYVTSYKGALVRNKQ